MHWNRGFVFSHHVVVDDEDVVITENTPSETNSFEERLKAIEEIQRCEVKLEKAKEKVEELVTKILEEKRKLRAQQQRGVFASWLAFEDDEYSEAISSWTAMVAVVTYFTAISMISLWFWKLVNLAFFGNGEMEESSFFTTTTGTTRSDESGSAKDDDDGKGERPIDSYAKVARHLNANKTPTSSIRGALRTPSDSGRSQAVRHVFAKTQERIANRLQRRCHASLKITSLQNAAVTANRQPSRSGERRLGE